MTNELRKQMSYLHKDASRVTIAAALSVGSSILSCLSLSIALSCAFAMTLSPVQASDAGKTTQFFRAQALQNIASGREEDALESYKSAIKVARVQYGSESTYLSELYFEMGNLARSNGQSEIAQNCYKSAVKYRPNDIPARLQLADLERNTKNIREAFEDSKRAFQINQNSPIARKGLMLCLQQCGRPAEAAQIAATLHRSGKATTTKFANNLSVPQDNAKATSAIVTPPETTPMVNNAVAVSTTSALHWAPDIKKKIDEAVAKKNKDARAAENAKKKQLEDLQKAENEKRNQHKKEEADRKAKQKSKKEEKAKKEETPKDKKSAAKAKPAFVEPEVNSASLKTSAKTISGAKSEDKSSEKTEKPSPKGHLGVGAVTEKVEKPVEEKHESSVSENEPARPKNPPPEKQQAAPALIPSMPIVAMPSENKKSRQPHLGNKGLVPPPPATPFFPAFPSAAGFQPQQSPVAPPPKPKPRLSKPAVKEAPKDSGDESAAASKGPSEDPDFLINWGGDSGKKKHSK